MGVGIIGSFAAREVLVSTLGLVYGLEADDDDPKELREAIRNDTRPGHGRAPLHAAHRPRADGVLRLRVPVHVDARRRAPRDAIVALAALHVREHDRHRLRAALLVYQGGRLLGF